METEMLNKNIFLELFNHTWPATVGFIIFTVKMGFYRWKTVGFFLKYLYEKAIQKEIGIQRKGEYKYTLF